MNAEQLRGMAYKQGFKVVVRGNECKLVAFRPKAVLKDRTRWLFSKHRDLFVKPEPEQATTEELALCKKIQGWLEGHFGPVELEALQREGGKVIPFPSTNSSTG